MDQHLLEVDLAQEGLRRKDLMKKPIQRRTVDYGSGITRWFQERSKIKSFRDVRYMLPEHDSIVDVNHNKKYFILTFVVTTAICLSI